MKPTSPALLLLADKQSYLLEAYVQTARRLGAEVVIGTDRCRTLAAGWAEALGDKVLSLPFREPEQAIAQIVSSNRRRPLSAVLSVSDQTTELAARTAAALGLPYHPPSAARAARSKIAMRDALARGGVSQPASRHFDLGTDPESLASEVVYPCVLKPALLSASRGVIRADDGPAFIGAWRRICRILEEAGPHLRVDPDGRRILVEEYVPGAEVAVEGLLCAGDLQILAIFDKPDPLVGPYFEETLYVTPTRHPPAQVRRLVGLARAATAALGLNEGPIHAELRDDGERAWVIEVAARPIGGLCSRTLRFGTGFSLEELVVRRALNLPVASAEREDAAAGVMMIPVPRAGVLLRVEGLDGARDVPLIEDITIEIPVGDSVVPAPEGNRYLGFIFARGSEAAAVEEALRRAHGCLRFEIRPHLGDALR